MIRYSCDLCKRELDPGKDLRYVAKIGVFAAFDPTSTDEDSDDREHLQEIQDILERLDSNDQMSDDQAGDELYHELRFDLCPDCRKRFLKNPLGRESVRAFDFSEN
jgi:hypothetical protein